MKIPNTIKILGMVYNVRLTNTLRKDISKYLNKKEKAQEFSGYFSSADTTIYLDAKNSKQNLESVFIHEVIEVINCQLALGLKHDNIDRLEAALYQVLTENNLLR